MNKIILAGALIAFCPGMPAAEGKAPAPGAAQEKARAGEKKDWKAWYDNLYKGLRSKVQGRFESKTRVSAVAAVRGSKTGSDAAALYWKGGVSEEARKKAEAERKALGDAVELVVNGDAAAGRAALEKFMRENPESAYLPEAREALEMLPAGEAAPAGAPASAGAAPSGK